ncbi:uncharacterized protein J8A68_003614 [[Candida] subhashii]|uniref:RRM domain-containing protein n=1 Tax=[Candida] subhashii TaxID=561895 RepID=A0A8J5QIZ6_9ASCO|nr:uncharacterized protein J8A68_003614 [[Candida] subhashii]KAG7662844.1 hypothetical protein J8A68_003614 [[Candida] subhashii]
MSYNNSSYRPRSGDHYVPRDRSRSQQSYQNYDSSRGGGAGTTYNKYQNRNYNRPSPTTAAPRTPYRSGTAYKPPSSSSFQSRQNVYNQYGSRYTATDKQFQLWMGDLDPTWTEETIEQIWTSLVEKPVSVKIIRDRFNTSKIPYCFVTFNSQNAVDLAVQRHAQQVPGSSRTFKLNHAGSSGAGGSQQSFNRGSGASGSAAGGSQNDYSMFVGDISFEVTDVLLFDKFNSKFPNQIKSARVIMDPNTGKSKGFGFVRFFSSEAFNKALVDMNGVTIGSKQIRVGVASSSLNETTQSSTSAASKLDYRRIQVPQPQPEFNQFTDPNNTSLIIRGLSSKVTEKELEQHFIAFGDLIYCQISDDLKTGYIKYYSRSSAETAVMWLHGQMINDCRLKISWGKSVPVEGEKVKYAPSSDRSTSYEKSTPAPLLFHSSGDYYHNYRLDTLDKDEIQQFSQCRDGSETVSTNEINELYTKSKIYREQLFESSIY